jgi:hypothetical protein
LDSQIARAGQIFQGISKAAFRQSLIWSIVAGIAVDQALDAVKDFLADQDIGLPGFRIEDNCFLSLQSRAAVLA